MGLNAINTSSISHDGFEYLAENLRLLLSQHNLNAHQLAQILGIPMMTIRRLLSGETTDPRISTLFLLANYFSLPIDSLIKKRHEFASTAFYNKATTYHVPLLDWDTASRMTSAAELDLTEWKEWQSISLGDKNAISKHAFALESRPSMSPRFPRGTLFIFDDKLEPKDGDIVLIRLIKNNQLTLRELMIDPPEWQLHPIVAGSSHTLLFSSSEHQMIGVSILALLFNRK